MDESNNFFSAESQSEYYEKCLEVEGLDDWSLIDECKHILKMCENEDAEYCIYTYDMLGYLEDEERERLEHFYILYHMEYPVEDFENNEY